MKTRSLLNMIFISSLSIYQIKREYYKTMEMSIMYSYFSYIYKLMKFTAKNTHKRILKKFMRNFYVDCIFL